MKAYKVELLVLDHNDMGEEQIEFLLENVKYLYPSVMSIESREIGEFYDDHPLNKMDTYKQAYKELFNDEDLKDV